MRGIYHSSLHVYVYLCVHRSSLYVYVYTGIYLCTAITMYPTRGKYYTYRYGSLLVLHRIVITTFHTRSYIENTLSSYPLYTKFAHNLWRIQRRTEREGRRNHRMGLFCVLTAHCQLPPQSVLRQMLPEQLRLAPAWRQLSDNLRHTRIWYIRDLLSLRNKSSRPCWLPISHGDNDKLHGGKYPLSGRGKKKKKKKG